MVDLKSLRTEYHINLEYHLQVYKYIELRDEESCGRWQNVILDELNWDDIEEILFDICYDDSILSLFFFVVWFIDHKLLSNLSPIGKA